MEKPIIIEFNGVPGSGKTTVTTSLIAELNSNNKIVCNFTDYFRQNKKSVSILVRSALYANKVHIYFLLINLFNTIMLKDGLELKRIKLVFDAFIHFLLLNYCYKKGNFNFIILDQGITQNWLSYYYDIEIQNTKSIEKIYSLIIEKYDDYYLVNTILKKEEVVKRINNRVHGTSRLDKIAEEKKYEIIETQINNLRLIRNTYPKDIVLNVDTLSNVNKNVENIIRYFNLISK